HDQLDQLSAFRLGQAAGHLVKQEQPRLGCERSRQFEPLAIEQCQLAGVTIGFVGEPTLIENFQAACSAITLALTGGSAALAKRCSDKTVLITGDTAKWLRDLERTCDT